MTNNPEKIDAVLSSGIEIVGRVSADVPANPHSADYLATKRDRLGHLSNAATDLFIVGAHSACGKSLVEAGNGAVGLGQPEWISSNSRAPKG